MRCSAFVSGLALAALASGCGQDPPPDLDGDYFPLRDGARYEYQHSKDGWVETVTFEARDDDRFLLEQSEDPDGNSSVSVIDRDGDDLLRTSEEQLVDGQLDRSIVYDPGFLRFSSAWLELGEGDEDARTYERTETEAGETAKPTAVRAHVYTIESLSETVSVPAGRFQNCLVVRRERDLENESGAGGVDTREEQNKQFWFAPGVGKVREANLITGSTEELIEYDLGED
jgi:hypothetical protein